MEFFLDTASIEEIKRYQGLGLVDGVTTNPALLAKEGKDPLQQLEEISSLVSGPVSAEVVETDADRIARHARKLARVADNIVVKIPASITGLAAAQELKADGVRLLVTLNFHTTQAVPFIKLGVEYVALFIGRTEDFAIDNKQLSWDTRQAIDNMNSPTKLMAASMRNPDYLIDSILANADVITVPPTCWEKVYQNPIFALAEREFLESWRQLPEDLRKTYESFDS
jgi:transaldolase